jgi:hypothetical protein
MKPVSSFLAKTALLAAAGIGLSACVAPVAEPVYYQQPTYYSAPGYYYQPYYAPPRPAYQSFYFSYRDDDRGRRGGRGHGYGHRGRY